LSELDKNVAAFIFTNNVSKLIQKRLDCSR